MVNTFQDLTGRTVGTLHIAQLARRVPELCWSVQCLRCGVQGVQRHSILLSGAAKCANSGCGRTPVKETRRTATTAEDGIRTATAIEARTFEQSQQRTKSAPDTQSEQRKAERIEAERRERDRLLPDYRKFYFHQIERGAEPSLTLEQFVAAGDVAQKRIMEIVERDNGGKE